jgi:tetratricopeptide (TPR) repeat protein
MGKPDEAVRTLETAEKLVGYSPLNLTYLSFAYAQAGRMREAQKCLEELEDLAKKTYVPAFAFAFVLASLGDIEGGFDWLDKAVDERDSLLLLLPSYPMGPLSSHPRFRALLHKMNLER